MEESCRISAVGCDLRVGGATTEELLIRMKKPFLVNEVLVISIIEQNIGGHIKWRQVVVVAQARTLGFC